MNMTIRSGSGKLTGFRRTVLMREKIAVLAPTPSARARTAVTVNPGAFRNMRMECLRSCKKDSMACGSFLSYTVSSPKSFQKDLFAPQCVGRVDPRDSPRGDPSGQQSHQD